MSDKMKPLNSKSIVTRVADAFRRAVQSGASKANEADMKIRYGTPEAATRTRKSNKKRKELREAFKLFQK